MSESDQWFIVGRNGLADEKLVIIPIGNILFDLEIVCVPKRLAKLHWAEKRMEEARQTIAEIGLEDEDATKTYDAYKRQVYKLAFK